jgi:hypothetical protein
MNIWDMADWTAWQSLGVQAVRAHGNGVTLVLNGEWIHIDGRSTARVVRGGTSTSVVTVVVGQGQDAAASPAQAATVGHAAARPRTPPRSDAPVASDSPPPPRRRRTRAPDAQASDAATTTSAPAPRRQRQARRPAAGFSAFGVPSVPAAGLCLRTGLPCIAPERCVGSRCQRG